MKETIGGTLIENGKLRELISKTGKCTQCLLGARNVRVKYVITTTTLKREQAKHAFNIF